MQVVSPQDVRKPLDGIPDTVIQDRTALLTLALEFERAELGEAKWPAGQAFAFIFLVSAALWAVIAGAFILI